MNPIDPEIARHPDWPQEAQHLAQTLALVASTLEESKATKRSIDDEVHRLMETGDPDSSIDYADLSVNLMIQGSLELRLRNLTEASRKPYFARVISARRVRPLLRRTTSAKWC